MYINYVLKSNNQKYIIIQKISIVNQTLILVTKIKLPNST
jgi:hypothetical protein